MLSKLNNNGVDQSARIILLYIIKTTECFGAKLILAFCHEKEAAVFLNHFPPKYLRIVNLGAICCHFRH